MSSTFELKSGVVADSSSQVLLMDKYSWLIPPDMITLEDLFDTHANGALAGNSATFPETGAPSWVGAISTKTNLAVGGDAGAKYIYSGAAGDSSAQGNALNVGMADHQACGLFTTGVMSGFESFGLLLGQPTGVGTRRTQAYVRSDTSVITISQNGTTALISAPFALAANTKYAMKFKKVGDKVTATVWKFGSTDSPVTITATLTEPAVIAGTQAGITVACGYGDGGPKALEFYAGKAEALE